MTVYFGKSNCFTWQKNKIQSYRPYCAHSWVL